MRKSCSLCASAGAGISVVAAADRIVSDAPVNSAAASLRPTETAFIVASPCDTRRITMTAGSVVAVSLSDSV